MTARTPCKSFHQPCEIAITPLSSRPAAIATKPNRIEIALTDA